VKRRPNRSSGSGRRALESEHLAARTDSVPPVMLVIDASMVVAGLTDSGADGRWAESLLAGDSLAAPHLMPAEAANILRRAALAGGLARTSLSVPAATSWDMNRTCRAGRCSGWSVRTGSESGRPAPSPRPRSPSAAQCDTHSTAVVLATVR
jgi:hypothetical protein